MKFKCAIFLILLAFLIMGSANAENSTDVDNLTTACDDVIRDVDLSDINVTFEEKMWEKNLSDINVDLPDEAEGNFTVKINDVVIYNESISNKSFKVPITLPKPDFELMVNIYPPYDCKTYKISAFYNDIDLNINRTLKVMKYPSDVDLLHFPEEILYNSQLRSLMVFPRSANDTVEFYIDEKFIKRVNAQPIIHWDDDSFSKLALGNHTLRVIYNGDDYYRPFNKTFNFTVVNVVISIPKVINISHDDCISVETLPGTEGTVKVYIDNALVYSSKTDDEYFVLSLEPYLKVASREIKVVYSNKDFTRTKTQMINRTFDFDIFSFEMIYGEENVIEVTLPDTLNTRLVTITINGVKYSYTHPEYIMNNLVEVDVSKLKGGNYSMLVSFAGDDRFEAKNKTYNFTINYEIMLPDDVVYRDSSKLYLNLPKDAKGNLVVYVDGVLVKTVKLVNGHAEVSIDHLSPGYHSVNARYDGEDYDVCEIHSGFYAEPKISAVYRFTAGEDKYVSLEVPKTCRGYVLFNIDGNVWKVSIKNGVARFSLKKLKAGEHEINVEYFGEDGVRDSGYPMIVTVYKPKIKILSAELSYKSANVKIKVLNKKGKVMANKKVTVILNNKKYTVKTNKKGIAVLNKKMNLKAKKSKITVKFMGAKATKKVKVKKISLRLSKTSKKIIIKANVKTPEKSRDVSFKVNGKSIAAKANKNGVLKFSIKKPKKGKVNVRATYLKDTVKSSLKIL